MIALFGTMAALLVSDVVSDPDAVVMRERAGVGSVPVATDPIQAATPSLTVTSASHGLTTEQQIGRWMQDRPVDSEAPVWRDSAVAQDRQRRVTGEVNLGIGTNDYSHASAHVTLPLGESSSLTLGYSQTKNALWWDRPMGMDGVFWRPGDEFRGPQWSTPSGRSYSPVGFQRSHIDERHDREVED